MKQIMYRVGAYMMAVLFCAVLIPSVFASSGMQYDQKATFFQWAGSLLQDVIGFSFGMACPNSDDGYHHADSTLGSHKDLISGKETMYYDCVCTYCGKVFTAYESDLKQSYDNQVQELPATVYGADGSIYVIPTFQIFHYDAFTGPTLSNGEVKEDSNGLYRASVNLPLIRYEILKDYYHSGSSCSYGVYLNYDIPFLCSAELLFSSATYSTNTQSGQLSFDSYGASYTGGLKNYSEGQRFRAFLVSPYFSVIKNGNNVLAGNYILFSLPDLRLKLTPYSTLSDTAYNTSSRPTAITGGNYGIVGDDGTINTVTNNNQIVNETNNTYYNPATGQTSTVLDWSYDYTDRSYSVTLENGGTAKVTYGDENITIIEGDMIYNIYYIIDGSGTGGDTHTHDWVQTGARQGNCLTPAQRTYTCTVCNEQRTETDPAPGHSWRAIRTVPTTYDEDGNLTQEGYTIYECERCNEQYKSTNITGPPSSGSGGSGGGSGSGNSDNIFSGIFGIFWDFCSFMFDFFSDFVLGGVKGFIGSLLDAGSDFFSILNPFSWDY